LSEPNACVLLVPLLTDGLNEFTAVLKDPSRDTADLAAIAAELRALEPIAPTAWRADLTVVDAVLQAVADAHGDPGRIVAATGGSAAFSDAGLRLGAQCRPYAT
jgi:hypothetical protein